MQNGIEKQADEPEPTRTKICGTQAKFGSLITVGDNDPTSA